MAMAWRRRIVTAPRPRWWSTTAGATDPTVEFIEPNYIAELDDTQTGAIAEGRLMIQGIGHLPHPPDAVALVGPWSGGGGRERGSGIGLDRLPPPVAPDRASLLGFRRDGVVHPASIETLRAHWPGSWLRWCDTGHVDTAEVGVQRIQQHVVLSTPSHRSRLHHQLFEHLVELCADHVIPPCQHRCPKSTAMANPTRDRHGRERIGAPWPTPSAPPC